MDTGWAPYRGADYLDFPSVEAWVRATAARFPEHVSLEVVGRSREGRPLLLLTLGERADHPERKPALWLDGATHAAEWTGVSAVLYSVSRWLEGLLTGDEATLERLRRTTVYALPVISPDGYQVLFEGSPFVRSTLRPPPEGTLRVGLDPRDVDGDGVVRWMRWRHPAGPWIHDPEVPLCMRPRTLDDDPADAWFLCDEGLLLQWDGARWTEASLAFGLDLNRNFPAHWEPFRMFGMDGGDVTLSEPESRAVVDAVRARPNIGAGLTNHTYTGALLTQPYRDPSPLSRADIDLMEMLGRQSCEGTGYRVIRTHPDFVYDPKKAIVGVWADTLSAVFGVPGYTLELWDPFGHAGVKLEKPAEFFAKPDVEVVRKVVRCFAEDPGAVRGWQPFDHPQLGRVEIGGLDYMRTVRNPPVALLEAECARGYAVAERLRRALPTLQAQASVEAVGGVQVLTLQVENLGFLPTSGLPHGEALGTSPGVRVDLELGEGLTLVEGQAQRQLGHLDGWGSQLVGNARHPIYPGLSDRGHRAVARWVLSGAGRLSLRWWSRQAGRGTIELEIG